MSDGASGEGRPSAGAENHAVRYLERFRLFYQYKVGGVSGRNDAVGADTENMVRGRCHTLYDYFQRQISEHHLEGELHRRRA